MCDRLLIILPVPRLLPIAGRPAAARISAAESTESTTAAAGIESAETAAIASAAESAAARVQQLAEQQAGPEPMPPPPPPPPPSAPRRSSSRMKIPKRISGQGMLSRVDAPDAKLRSPAAESSRPFDCAMVEPRCSAAASSAGPYWLCAQRGTHVVQQQPRHSVGNRAAETAAHFETRFVVRRPRAEPARRRLRPSVRFPRRGKDRSPRLRSARPARDWMVTKASSAPVACLTRAA